MHFYIISSFIQIYYAAILWYLQRLFCITKLHSVANTQLLHYGTLNAL